MGRAEFSPKAGRVSDGGIDARPEQALAPRPKLEPGEREAGVAEGVLLGWQPRTIIIWWVPGIVFIALSQVEFHSWLVTAALAVFCVLLFAFYASDREVRPRASSKEYLVTNTRVWIGNKADTDAWREVPLRDIAATHMEDGLADRVVRRLSGAATVVLVLRQPGPKGEPRRVRLGPMRHPQDFRAAIDRQLTMFERRF
jgi:hypothetical protein